MQIKLGRAAETSWTTALLCPEPCRMLSSISGLDPLDACGPLPSCDQKGRGETSTVQQTLLQCGMSYSAASSIEARCGRWLLERGRMATELIFTFHFN